MVCKPESAEGGWEDFGRSVSCDAEAHTSMMENATPKVARKMITTKFLAIFSDKILVVSMAFALGSIAADVCARCDSFSIHNTPHWRKRQPRSTWYSPVSYFSY